MKIIIIGSKGMLGSDLTLTFGRDHDIFEINRKECDITDIDQVIQIIKGIKPDLVIHAAAYTKVDDAEKESDLAFKVNGLGTRNIAIACQKTGAAILYFSTDYVFDGLKGSPYKEFDRPNPLNTYGESKLMGEYYVENLSDKYYIVRTSWLYGRKGINFVDTICNKVREKKELSVVDDQFGSPTSAIDLSEKINAIIRNDRYGIFHVTNGGVASWYDFTKKIIEIANIKDINIIPIKSSQLARPAKRPSYSVLDNFILRVEGIPVLRDWQESLTEYLNV